MSKKSKPKQAPPAEPTDPKALLVLKVLDAVPGHGDPALSRKPSLNLLTSIIKEKSGVPSLEELHAALVERGTHWAELLAVKVADLITAQKDENQEAKAKTISGGWIRIRQGIASVYDEARSLRG